MIRVTVEVEDIDHRLVVQRESSYSIDGATGKAQAGEVGRLGIAAINEAQTALEAKQR